MEPVKPSRTHLRSVPPSTSETAETRASDEETVLTVDPGQVIRVGAVFPGKPERILFSHLPPGADVAIHDPPFGEPGSKIELLPSGVYRRVIDTRRMRGGEGWWSFSSEDDANPGDLQRARVDRFRVREVPTALLERGGAPGWKSILAGVTVPEQPRVATGYEILGRSVRAESEKTLLILLGIKVAAGLLAWAAS